MQYLVDNAPLARWAYRDAALAIRIQGIGNPLVDTVTDNIDWHDVARLVRLGFPASLAVAIVKWLAAGRAARSQFPYGSAHRKSENMSSRTSQSAATRQPARRVAR